MSPQRLALDLQAARQENASNLQIIDKLLKEIDRQNAEIDQLRSAKRVESDFRLEAEGALDKTRDRLRLAVDAAGLALWDWDVTSPDVYHTARWGEMIDGLALEGNWKLDDLLARVHPEDLPTVHAFLNALTEDVSNIGPQSMQYRINTPQGWLYVETYGMVTERDDQGRVVRLMGTHADITQRKQQRALLERARERAEEASQVKGAFLANISHEIRTPLNALMGLTHLLMDSPLSDQQKHWLALIDKSSQNLLSLLNDVLDLSRIESGKVSIEPTRVDLHDLLADLSDLYEEQASQRSLRWAMERAAEVPRFIQCDETRFRQVLTNLISNALKFTPAGGQVRLLVDVGTKNGGSSGPVVLRLRVQDTGIGIAPANQASIFEEFVQANDSVARQYGGSGLGLAISAKLVRLMGGEIAVESALGQGSTFTVKLPLSDELPEPGKEPDEQAAKPAVRAPSPLATDRFKGLQVLTADDHPVNELLMQELLGRLGCEVLVARDGHQALAEWKRSGVRLILMDVQMPGMNGLDATRAIRKEEARQPRPRTWVIGVTANVTSGDRERCLAAGMDGYVSKPIRPAALVEAMQEGCTAIKVCNQGAQAVDRQAGQPPTASQKSIPDLLPQTPSASPVAPAETPGEGTLVDELFTPQQVAQLLSKDLPPRLALLKQASVEQDAALALAQCHLLRGSLGWVNQPKGLRLVKGLELAVNTNNWPLFAKVLGLLQAEILALMGLPGESID
jgi:signal transduction histidine kinase/CheY-like chemotaxis protein